MEITLLIFCNLPVDGFDFYKLGTYFMDFKGHGSFFGKSLLKIEKMPFFGSMNNLHGINFIGLIGWNRAT